MLLSYEIMFGEKPKEYLCPIKPKDHPELDVTELLDDTEIIKYQSLIGALQWVVTLEHFDVLVAVCTMSTYRVTPHVGYLHRLKRMFRYLKKHQDGAVRFRVEIPDHEST
jgi:hypothetical protein